jgi:hypothetical protein
VCGDLTTPSLSFLVSFKGKLQSTLQGTDDLLVDNPGLSSSWYTLHGQLKLARSFMPAMLPPLGPGWPARYQLSPSRYWPFPLGAIFNVVIRDSYRLVQSLRT